MAFRNFLCFLAAAAACAAEEGLQRENLDRGLAALRTSPTEIYLSWRLFTGDAPDAAFNILRVERGGTPVTLNPGPLTATTDFIDTDAPADRGFFYKVEPLAGALEEPASPAVEVPANSPVSGHLTVPLERPPEGRTPDRRRFQYDANDCSVGDLTGDGRFEIIVKWNPTNARDNSHNGHTGNVILDACQLDGTRLWRIDLGPNIRAGAHYTQFLVYDFDGDGIAEIVCRTAPGSRDGKGTFVGGISKWQDAGGGKRPDFKDRDDYRNPSGRILSGPEFLTVFDGRTGAELASSRYLPERGSPRDWGDDYGNRVDRFLAGAAYLDGKRPSIVMTRGYYTRSVLAAWDWRQGKLSQRWIFDSDETGNKDYAGQGAHSLSVGDVDGDGCDEIIFGAAVINNDGSGLHTTRLGHGDALHVGDFDPSRPGLEIFMPHESPRSNGGIGASLRDARSGEILWTMPARNDVGRGVPFDIDPRHRGAEMWTSQGALFTIEGEKIQDRRPSCNFAVWWDADFQRELLDRNTISKWDPASGQAVRLLTADGQSINGSKAVPCFSGDILGDWREEVIFRAADSSALHIHSTTIPATRRIPTLLQDRQYRLALVWQNVGYNQPPHPSFNLTERYRKTPEAPAE